MRVANFTELDFSGSGTTVVIDYPCVFLGFLVGMDGANDPLITIYNSATTTVAAKSKVVPSNTYDASMLNINGAMPGVGVWCTEGITVDVTLSSGACEITVYWGQ